MDVRATATIPMAIFIATPSYAALSEPRPDASSNATRSDTSQSRSVTLAAMAGARRSIRWILMILCARMPASPFRDAFFEFDHEDPARRLAVSTDRRDEVAQGAAFPDQFGVGELSQVDTDRLHVD